MFSAPFICIDFSMFSFWKTVFIVGKYLSNKTAEKDMLQFFFFFFISFCDESLIILQNNGELLRFISRAKFKPQLTGCLENILFCCLWALIKMCSSSFLFSLAPTPLAVSQTGDQTLWDGPAHDFDLLRSPAFPGEPFNSWGLISHFQDASALLTMTGRQSPLEQAAWGLV